MLKPLCAAALGLCALASAVQAESEPEFILLDRPDPVAEATARLDALQSPAFGRLVEVCEIMGFECSETGEINAIDGAIALAPLGTDDRLERMDDLRRQLDAFTESYAEALALGVFDDTPGPLTIVPQVIPHTTWPRATPHGAIRPQFVVPIPQLPHPHRLHAYPQPRVLPMPSIDLYRFGHQAPVLPRGFPFPRGGTFFWPSL